MDVSIIIVNYNTCELTTSCIDSIYKYTNGIDYEIIVIDNNSTDNSKNKIQKEFRDIIYVQNDSNYGFGKANNIGARYAKGKYLFLLNSDCLLVENTIKNFYNFMENEGSQNRIGLLGCLLYDANMKLNTSYQRFPTLFSETKNILNYSLSKFGAEIFKNYKGCNYIKDLKTYNSVEFISGAAMFISSNLFSQLNGFDEQFFLYYEETDLQKRMNDLGYKRMILGDQKIIHLEGSSSKKNTPSLKSTIIFKDSMYKYFYKNHSIIYYTFFYLIITPLTSLLLLNPKYSKKEKNKLLKVLLRKEYTL